jgi:TonB-linked SusC/RagA family outer membrane protein
MNKLRYLLLFVLTTVVQSVLAQGVVTGTVIEKNDTISDPCIGVNVAFVNSQNRLIVGTTTDMSGRYSLRVPENEKGQLTLVFSYIGMKTQRIKYTKQAVQNVTMGEDNRVLKEVEVTARRHDRSEMGVTSREMTFATQKISMQNITESSPVSSVEEALQGQLSGVDIVAASDPGAKSSIRIRGTATLNSNSDPLIVINGVPYSTSIDDTFDFNTASQEDFANMLSLNPNDIETIEVLKDAASTAIYGTAGANGVLLITTKKGNKGKTNFTFSTKNTVKIEPKSMPMLNGNEYVAYIQDAIWNTANARGLQNSSALLEYLFNTPEINYNQNWRYFDEYNQDVDWLSYVKKDAIITDNSFSMSGGGERATYRASMSYLNEGGTTVGTGLRRLTTSLNIGYYFSDKLRVDAEYTYSDTKKDANWTDKVRAEALRKMPNKSPYYIDNTTGDMTDTYFIRQNSDEFQGAFTGSQNFHPIIMANDSYRDIYTKEQKMTFRANYFILPELTYTGYVSMKYNTIKTESFLPQNATGVTSDNTYSNRSEDNYSDAFSLQTENKLMFIKKFNEDVHSIVATLLWRTSQSKSSNYASSRYNVASSSTADPASGGGTLLSEGSGTSEVRTLSGIGSLCYTLLNRYTVNATANYEGKSSLGKDNRWGFFPSVGVAWQVQDEHFMEGVKNWWSQFKIRASIGQSGNAPSGTSPYVGTYNAIGNYMDGSAIAPATMQLNKLKWETSTEYDFGVDLGFFNDKLRATFDYYHKKTKDLLQKNVTIPSSTGYATAKIAYYNSGKISNKGWEFRVDYDVLKSKTWTFSMNFNINRNINTIDELPSNIASEQYSLSNGKYAQKLIAGTSVGSFFGYRYKGVYQNTEDTYAKDDEGNVMRNLSGNPIVMKNGTYICYPGDAKYEDINHDGKIDQNDIVYIGNCNPIVSGGGGFNLKYKGFGLTVFLHYRLGQKVINTARMDAESMYNADNQSKAVLRRWRNEGDDTDIPRALWKYGLNYLGSDRFVENCSFVRLKTISFSYDMSKQFCKHLGVNKVSFFLTGYDLFTFSNYTGQDPEVSLPSSVTALSEDDAQTPRSKRFSVGITVNF